MAKLVSKTYGDALFELALEEDKLDLFFAESEVIRQVFLENRELIKLLNHPKIDKEEKISVMEDIFKDRASNEFVGFLTLVVRKERQNDIVGILDYFVSQVKEYKKIGVAHVSSAKVLNDTQRAEVEKKLLATTEYQEFEMTFSVDESLIGGLVIRIGDRVVNNSIKHKLNELAKDLYDIQLA